ncbi:hypothetical protein AOLI_G00234750 [Acnodon oligacanthus]
MGDHGHDDTLVEWNGWYRLYLQGKSAQIPESDWCASFITCGGYTPLFLGGSHPRPQDGIVTREIYGSYGYVSHISQCNSYRSNPIQVKACPGDYYVYRLVKPAVSLPMPTYCAVVFDTLTYDPCNNYTALDQPWRASNATGLKISDSDFNWNGWYRLLYYGMSVRMPDSCVDENRCGTETTLWLNGSHPQIEDGIVTRGVCGTSGSDCCYYRSTPIKVKACPGNYYVYEFVKSTTDTSAYCAADIPQNITSDPCITYNVLDDKWRTTERLKNYQGFDDTLLEWNGWYRLYLQGKSAQIPESEWCWNLDSCGGYTALFLGGSHPRPWDGIVTRDIYGNYDYATKSEQCDSYRSNPIEVKACPGNYYVYRLAKPALSLPMPTYCAVAFNTLSYDPCSKYTSLNQPWRGTNETGGWITDSDFNWNGWYRLLYDGMSVRMPESCVDESRCGTDTTLWLNGSHPQMEDGIVTRGVCGIKKGDCCYYRSTPIRVKACPGNYYVYEFVKPNTYAAAYCADVNTITPNSTLAGDAASGINTADSPKNVSFDPCNVYSVLDNEWRRMASSFVTSYRGFDDTLVEWSGWYRLYLQGQSAQIPESDFCASFVICGGYTPLFLGASHPLLEDGIVTREIYGSYGFRLSCRSQRSNPIQVKACPGNYYVYKLVQPAVSLPLPTYCAVVLSIPSYDPCYNYTALDQPWRGTNEIGGFRSDESFDGNGWYRLLYRGRSVRMPESCVNPSRCGTYFTLWLNGSHPQIEDGIVTRGVCGRRESDCCYFRFTPIRVKACPGNYYVYEFVPPSIRHSAYCADQSVRVSRRCMLNFTAQCADNLFDQIKNSTNPVLPPNIVTMALKKQVLNVEVKNTDQPVSSGNTVLNKIELLVSTLVMPTVTKASVNISLNELVVQVFTVGSDVSLKEIPQLSVHSAQMDIDLIQISKNSNGTVPIFACLYLSPAKVEDPIGSQVIKARRPGNISHPAGKHPGLLWSGVPVKGQLSFSPTSGLFLVVKISWGATHHATMQSFVDSVESFLDVMLVAELGLPFEPLEHPLLVMAIDSRSLGSGPVAHWSGPLLTSGSTQGDYCAVPHPRPPLTTGIGVPLVELAQSPPCDRHCLANPCPLHTAPSLRGPAMLDLTVVPKDCWDLKEVFS